MRGFKHEGPYVNASLILEPLIFIAPHFYSPSFLRPLIVKAPHFSIKQLQKRMDMRGFNDEGS